jgi:AcrR family transcriptional regulator
MRAPKSNPVGARPVRKRSFAERARSLAVVEPKGKGKSNGSDAALGERALRTRDQLIETAVSLFLERGYGGTTIDHIAEAAGMSRASFYTYFPSKREILLLAGMRSNAARTTCVSTISAIPEDWNLEHLKTWVRAYLAFLDVNGGFQLVWSQASWFDEELRSLGVKGSMNSARIVGTHMRRIGATDKVDARIQGLGVLSMLDRFWYFWRKTEAPFGEGEVVDGLARMLQSLLR